MVEKANVIWRRYVRTPG